VVPVASAPNQVGRVVGTDPGQGIEVDAESVVTMRVGRGPDRVQAPSLVGQTAEQAQTAVQAAGLTLTPVPQQREVDDPAQVGKVLAQDPPPGSLLAPGTPIQLTVGQRRETLRMPDVTGQPQATAEATLEGIGLKVTATQVDGSQPSGTVVDTSPSAGSTVNRGSSVTLEVSRGNTKSVPSVVGQTPSEAVSTLAAAGFNGNLQQTFQAGDASQSGKIISQSPSAGGTAAPGETISVVVGTPEGGGGGGGGSTGEGEGGLFPNGVFGN
jgi:eukaryotic-like serine/threonine-protein kinase